MNKIKLGNVITVSNMVSDKGNTIANQFSIITDKGKVFQSYQSNIVARIDGKIYLDEYYYNYSRTTSKYRNLFLGRTTKEIERGIKEGEFILTNLN